MDNSNKSIVIAGLSLSAGVLTSLALHYLQQRKANAIAASEEAEDVNLTTEAGVPQRSIEDDEDAIRRKFIQELIRTNKGKHKDFNRIRITEGSMNGNTLLEEIQFIDSAICEIEKVPNLILDLGLEEFQVLLNPLVNKMHADTFINTNSYILSYAAFGPSSLMQNAKRWLRAGPRQHNYFAPAETKAIILTQDGLCPGLNVVIREVVMNLAYNYKVQEIYGAKNGWKGIAEEDFEKLVPGQVKTIHHRGGSYLGTSRTGFNRDKIIDALVKHNFNQVYVVCGSKSLSQVLELYYEIRRRKLNIAICNIPRSVDNDIPIIDESFGFQSAVEEGQRIIESAWVESRSHKNGVGLVRVMGSKSGYLAMGASLASRCVNVCLVPEFNYNLYGSGGVLEHIKQRIITKGHVIVVVSEGVGNSFIDVDEAAHEDIGKFIQEEILKYFAKDRTEVTVKYFDPQYMLRSVRANAYDTKQCSTLAQNAVHCQMAGFTGFSIGHVHNKTCMIPLEEILSGNYRNRLSSNTKDWRRLLASTGQPSFLKEEDIAKIAI